MMMIYWVAIGARIASKLCPPCLKGNALPILKTLPLSPKLWLQVVDVDTVNGQRSTFHRVFGVRRKTRGFFPPSLSFLCETQLQKQNTYFGQADNDPSVRCRLDNAPPTKPNSTQPTPAPLYAHDKNALTNARYGSILNVAVRGPETALAADRAQQHAVIDRFFLE